MDFIDTENFQFRICSLIALGPISDNTITESLEERNGKPIDERFKDTVFVVEATSFERNALWRDRHKQLDWEQDYSGFCQTVGKIPVNGKLMPITVSVLFAKILGQRIVFYESESMIVAHLLVEKWVMRQAGNPTWDNGRKAHCNAHNFHHCVHACEERKEKLDAEANWA